MDAWDLLHMHDTPHFVTVRQPFLTYGGPMFLLNLLNRFTETNRCAEVNYVGHPVYLRWKAMEEQKLLNVMSYLNKVIEWPNHWRWHIRHGVDSRMLQSLNEGVTQMNSGV